MLMISVGLSYEDTNRLSCPCHLSMVRFFLYSLLLYMMINFITTVNIATRWF
jgi:hypothetical protein